MAAPRIVEPEKSPVVTEASDIAVEKPVLEAREPAAPVEETPVAQPTEEPTSGVPFDPQTGTADPLKGLFEMVGNFLRSTSEAFGDSNGDSSIRYRYSESFKLSLLQSVINTVAPDESGAAADAAVALIEKFSPDSD
ncbi:MAG: hypothetical protein HKN13_06835 [Rhodothermales bacterium]|nr:hypothetical protein [Rhodothermales bacterium]